MSHCEIAMFALFTYCAASSEDPGTPVQPDWIADISPPSVAGAPAAVVGCRFHGGAPRFQPLPRRGARSASSPHTWRVPTLADVGTSPLLSDMTVNTGG